jgi:hypothetical protein
MPKWFELRAYRGARPVRTAGKILDALDLDNPEGTKDLLTRHLLAVAERDGARRRDAHLYHLDVHEIHGERVARDPFFQFSIPVEA